MQRQTPVKDGASAIKNNSEFLTRFLPFAQEIGEQNLPARMRKRIFVPIERSDNHGCIVID
jgi:hypothetical protein